MRSCRFASEIQSADYSDEKTNTPIFNAKCTRLAGKVVEEELRTNSYNCATCAIARDIHFSLEH
jgi:hypothetical protein